MQEHYNNNQKLFGFPVDLGLRSSWHVVQLSSNANNSANTGAFYLNANNTSSNLNQNIGRQLTLLSIVKENKEQIGKQIGNPATWQNT